MRQIRKRKIKELQLEQVDIREVLDNLGIYYTESGKNVSDGWIGTQCPFPNCDDQSNHMGLCLASPVISCMVCGRSGNYLTYLAAELGSFDTAYNVLTKAVPKELKPYVKRETKSAAQVELPGQASRIISPYHEAFLESRNFDYKKLEEQHRLYYCGPLGDWANHIIVPVYRKKQLITFTSICIADEVTLRYKHLSEEKSIIPIKQYLYGVEDTDRRSCIIVEGIFDKWRIGKGCMATFGTILSAPQIKMLSAFDRVIILNDGDKAGRTGAAKTGANLSSFCDVVIVNLPEGIDPDLMATEDIKEVRNML